MGRQRERKIANALDLSDITSICATLEFFNQPNVIVYQTAIDLREPFRYRVFDWLATNLDRCVNEKQWNDNSNVWVALGNVYLNTSSPAQFVEALRFNDLQLWEGKFTSKEFCDSIKAWDDADLKWKASEHYKKLRRHEEGIDDR